MKANELMIGDWVMCYSMLHKITSVGTNVAEIYDWQTSPRYVDTEQLQPIPLTAEILEKNGWIKTHNRSSIGYYTHPDIPYLELDYHSVLSTWETYKFYSLQAYRYYGEYKMYFPDVRTVETDEEIFIPINEHLYYVHELQHALRLCGIEKDIEL